MSFGHNIRVVVGIDFGTTYSGFSYAHTTNRTVITTNNEWPELLDQLKTNTVLRYDESGKNVEEWGYPAIGTRSSQQNNLLEFFKLHLSDVSESEKPYLPPGFDYKKVITDYLREMGKLIKDTLKTRWRGIEMYHILFVLAVPAEFSDKSIAILRECASDAKLINKKNSLKLQFTTEPEAAAIHCIDVMDKKERDEIIGKSFLVVDCGGGTVDLTMRKLLSINELDEMTIRTGDLCGGIYVDQEFVKFLKLKIGESAIEALKKDHYGQYQNLIQVFCEKIKLPFTGTEENETYELNIEEICPEFKKCINGSKKKDLEDKSWLIKLKSQDVKKMFDPVIDKIIKLIKKQLDADNTCSSMFLVGGFSESKYLQKRVEEEFKDQLEHISVPPQPIAAVARGALKYGLNEKFIKNRVLKYTYGRSTLRPFDESIDPIDRKRESGQVLVFKSLAKKGTKVGVNQKFSQISTPENSDQTAMWYKLLITEKDDVKYCDEEGVESLGECIVDLPDTHLGNNRQVYFELTFGKMEVQAYAKNMYNNKEYRTTFDLFV